MSTTGLRCGRLRRLQHRHRQRQWKQCQRQQPRRHDRDRRNGERRERRHRRLCRIRTPALVSTDGVTQTNVGHASSMTDVGGFVGQNTVGADHHGRTVTDSGAVGGNYTAEFAGANAGSISGSSVTTATRTGSHSVSGVNDVGGFAGSNIAGGTITTSSVAEDNANVVTVSSTGSRAGGFVGLNAEACRRRFRIRSRQWRDAGGRLRRLERRHGHRRFGVAACRHGHRLRIRRLRRLQHGDRQHQSRATSAATISPEQSQPQAR